MASPQNEYAFDYEAMRQAAEHWRRRDQDRKHKADAVRNKQYDKAETKERLTKWVNRTIRHVKGGIPAHAGALPDRLSELVERESYTEDEVDNDLVERIIGETRDFLAVAWLERGIQAVRSVGRIATRLGNGRQGYGTGFMVSPRLLLTNHHVLKTADHARASVIEFDYQVDRIDQPLAVQRFALDPDAFFLFHATVDQRRLPTSGGQFFGCFEQYLMSAERRALIGRLLLEWISLRGICRIVGAGSVATAT
jgi:endonuclease G